MFNEGNNEERKVVVDKVENELAHDDGVVIVALVLEVFTSVVLDGKLFVDEASDGHENGVPECIDTIIKMMLIRFPNRRTLIDEILLPTCSAKLIVMSFLF